MKAAKGTGASGGSGARAQGRAHLEQSLAETVWLRLRKTGVWGAAVLPCGTRSRGGVFPRGPQGLGWEAESLDSGLGTCSTQRARSRRCTRAAGRLPQALWWDARSSGRSRPPAWGTRPQAGPASRSIPRPCAREGAAWEAQGSLGGRIQRIV